MKKIFGFMLIAAMLIAAMLLSCAAFAEEEFAMHSGVTFGMTAQDVIKLEKANGFDAEMEEGSLYITGTVAGFDSSLIRYYLDPDSDTVFNVHYRVGKSSGNRDTQYVDFQTIQKSLETKYGAPVHSDAAGTYTNLPGTYRGQVVTGFAWAKKMTFPLAKVTWTVEDYYQWEVMQGDGSVILIDHYFICDSMGGSKSYVQWISYVHYNAADVEALNEKTVSMGNDL